MKKRREKVIKKYSIILGLGILYLVWVLITGFAIPCPFKLIFNLKCPGCGITSMMLASVRLDIRSAFLFNPFLFTTFPIIFLLIICPEIAYVRHGTHSLGKLKFLAWLELALAVAFGVLRNVI